MVNKITNAQIMKANSFPIMDLAIKFATQVLLQKILHLMVRDNSVRVKAEIERISIGKVLRTLSQFKY